MAEVVTTASTVERLSSVCNRFAERSLLALGLTMAVVVIAQVFCRYVLNHSLFWSEELARYLLVWLTFLGGSVAYYRRMHPGVEVLYSRLSPRLKLWANLFSHGVSLLLFGVMIVYGIRFAYFVRLQTTPALSLPKWVVFAIVPLSGMLLTLHAVTFLLRERRKARETP